MIENIGYDLSLSVDNPYYVSRQADRFNRAFESMFQNYLTKYGSSSSHIHTMHQEAGLSSHGTNKSI